MFGFLRLDSLHGFQISSFHIRLVNAWLADASLADAWLANAGLALFSTVHEAQAVTLQKKPPPTNELQLIQASGCQTHDPNSNHAGARETIAPPAVHAKIHSGASHA